LLLGVEVHSTLVLFFPEFYAMCSLQR